MTESSNTSHEKPQLSDDPHDKFAAAALWFNAELQDGPTYQRAPAYFDACLEWHEKLSAEEQDLCLTVLDLAADEGEPAAEKAAASLPPAPRCPL